MLYSSPPPQPRQQLRQVPRMASNLDAARTANISLRRAALYSFWLVVGSTLSTLFYQELLLYQSQQMNHRRQTPATPVLSHSYSLTQTQSSTGAVKNEPKQTPIATIGILKYGLSVQPEQFIKEDGEHQESADISVRTFAMAHVRNREAAYRNASKSTSTGTKNSNKAALTWSMRGIGYAYTQHGAALAVVLPTDLGAGGRRVIEIVNTSPTTKFNPNDWTIWIRVSGPEIFAGAAVPVVDDRHYHWEFVVDLATVGEYAVDSKLLVYNGQNADAHACDTEKDDSVLLKHMTHSPHNAMIGFKMYETDAGCCEICSRTKNCTYWATPPLSMVSDAHQQGCELFYSGHSSSINSKNRDQYRRRLTLSTKAGIAHGPSHTFSTAHFTGCGWSFWFSNDYPCLDPFLDDAVPVYPAPSFSVMLSSKNVAIVSRRVLPLCHIVQEADSSSSSASSGRWVRQPVPHQCGKDIQFDHLHSSMFNISQWDGTRPECWHRDDLSSVGQKCVEFCATDSHTPWMSHLKRETNWYGKWRPYKCRIHEFTDTELQQCIDRRKISSIVVQGKSIAAFLKQYLNQRLSNIALYNASSNDSALKVTLTTFGLPHLLWGKPEPSWHSFVDSLPTVPADQETYWVSAYFYSSEREPHVHVTRAIKLTNLLRDSLAGRNYRMLNAMDMTAAFTFDTATQNDGLHIIGPPAKMILTKFFHYLCTDSVD